jgi:hypothetical protein
MLGIAGARTRFVRRTGFAILTHERGRSSMVERQLPNMNATAVISITYGLLALFWLLSLICGEMRLLA